MQLHNNLNSVAGLTLNEQLSRRIPVETLNHARDIGLSLLPTFVGQPSYVLGVTSALPSEGKTTISTALAEVMAADFGLRSILIDSHAERPWPALGDDQIILRGLSDWLSDKCSLEDNLIHIYDKCAMLPFGAQLMSSRDLLQHLVKADALPQLRERYSLILLDLPDLINPAAAALANLCDGIMLVIHAGKTPADKFKEVIPLLQNVTIHGAVLNRHKSRIPAIFRRMFA